MSGWLEVVLLSVALAADATAVAAALGAQRSAPSRISLAALLFGLFQAGMSALGWLGGAALTAGLGEWTEVVAGVVLLVVGGRMAWGALRADESDKPQETGLTALILVSIATSLDALATGVSLPLLGPPPAASIAAIGGITSALSLFGGALGRRLGDRYGSRLVVVGGVVIVGLGLRFLVW